MKPNHKPPFLHLLLAVLLIAGAFALRMSGLAHEPCALYADEAGSAVESLRMVRTGDVPFYLPNPAPEDLFAVIGAPFVGLIGPSLLAVRLVSVFISLIGLAAAYRAARHLGLEGSARWAGLIGLGMLAAMPGYFTLSRAVYRGVMLAPALLLFFDCFIAAWRWGRRRDQIGAGVWLAVSIMSYTSGLAALPLAAVGVAYQIAAHVWPKLTGEDGAKRAPWRGLATSGVAFAVAISPHAALMILRPDFYARAASLGGGSVSIGEKLAGYAAGIAGTAASFILRGDPNPRYNAAAQPLINHPLLVALFLIGLAACLVRIRRPAHLMALAMLGIMMLPVALTNEIPHGLRISGEFAAVPLVAAAGLAPILWAAAWIAKRRSGLAAAARVAGAAVLIAGIGWAGLHTSQVYQDYFSPAIAQAHPQDVPDFATIFETRRLVAAREISQPGHIYYIPLSEASWSPMHYLMAGSYPHIETYAAHFKNQVPLQLPAGAFVLTSGGRKAQNFAPGQGDSTRVLQPPPPAKDASDFVMLLPGGRMVLLPRFDEATLAALRSAMADPEQTLSEPYGAQAGVVVDFPPDGSPFPNPGAPGHKVDLNYDNQLGLVGWDGQSSLARGIDTLSETLYLTRGKSFSKELRLFAQLWNADHTPVGSTEEPTGLYSYFYPMSEWLPGDVVPYEVSLKVPGDLPAGVYSLMVGVYDWRGGLVPVLGADGKPAADIGEAVRLKVQPRKPISTDGMTAAPADFGGQMALLGYRIDGPDGKPVAGIGPGQSGTITLFWQASRRPDADYTFFLHVEDSAGRIVAQQDTQTSPYPTGVLDPGEVVTTSHAISLPADARGPFKLYVGAYSFPDLTRLAASQNGQPAADNRVLLAELP